jgi:hypothetical protein
MPLARSTRAAVIAAITLTIAGCGASAANPSPQRTASPTSAPASTVAIVPVSPSPSPDPTPTEAPTPTEGPTVYDTTPLGAAFDLPLTMTLPVDWIAMAPPTDNPDRNIDVNRTGHPASDTSQWWGFSLHLVDGAWVADPKDIHRSASVAKLPWPKSYIDYLVALPGVEVVTKAGPTKVDGVDARQVTIKTPEMHPTIWLKGDYTWLGGGANETDPALTRHVIELTVHGKRLVIDYALWGDDFDKHAPDLDAVIKSIKFPG